MHKHQLTIHYKQKMSFQHWIPTINHQISNALPRKWRNYYETKVPDLKEIDLPSGISEPQRFDRCQIINFQTKDDHLLKPKALGNYL